MSGVARVLRAFRYLREGRLLARLAEQPRRVRGASRTRWWASRRSDGRGPIVELQSGCRLQLYLDSKLCEALYCWGFEEEEQDFVTRFLRPGDVFVDVGANIGLFSVIASSRVGSNGRVISFEPASSLRERLSENLCLNSCSNVSVLSYALSDTQESRALSVCGAGFDAWSTLASGGTGDRPSKTEMVRCRTLSDVAKETPEVLEACFLKIDVEGWETRVLRGAAEVLRNHVPRVLLIEFSRAPQQQAGSSYEELWNELRKQGFEVFRVPRRGGSLESLGAVPEADYINVIATRFPAYLLERISGS